MLGKCANPVCHASFRKLGSGKLFAFESAATAKAAKVISSPGVTNEGQSPVFFWLCETCSLTFTLGLDAAGELTMYGVRTGDAVTIFDRHPVDQTA